MKKKPKTHKLWTGWVILPKHRKRVTWKQFKILQDTGVLFYTKPDKDDLENALFDPKGEKVMKITLELWGEK